MYTLTENSSIMGRKRRGFRHGRCLRRKQVHYSFPFYYHYYYLKRKSLYIYLDMNFAGNSKRRQSYTA